MSDGREAVRVLVVDDEMSVADSLVSVLKARGHDAAAAYSAEAAMRLAEKMTPQAVISDIVMGPVSGIELAIHIREQYPGCRVLLVSGYAAAGDFAGKTQAWGSTFSFASKPVSPDRVLEFVAGCGLERAPRERVVEGA